MNKTVGQLRDDKKAFLFCLCKCRQKKKGFIKAERPLIFLNASHVSITTNAARDFTGCVSLESRLDSANKLIGTYMFKIVFFCEL